MRSHPNRLRAKIVALLLLTWGEVLCGQTRLPTRQKGSPDRPGLAGTGGRAVPVFSLGMGTAPLGTISTAMDSTQLGLLEIEIQKAEERVAVTSFWRRFLPQIHMTASYGVRDLMFVDPATFVPYIIPRDAYRLTISISLNDVLNPSQHSQALFDLEKLKAEYVLRRLQQAQSRKTLEVQLASFDHELYALNEELALIRELLQYNELRFEQGKIEFDALTRTKLELLNAKKALKRLQQQITQTQLRLSTTESK